MSQETNVAQIRQYILAQSMKGRGLVYIRSHERVIGVRKKAGKLQVRTLIQSESWQTVESVTIE